MKDIFVVLVVIIFIIASFLEQMKKKQVPQPPAPQPKEDDDWDEAGTSVQSSPADKLFDHIYETAYSFSPEQEGARTIFEQPVHTPKKPTQKKIRDSKQFSLKQAVIFSEILNRKYS